MRKRANIGTPVRPPGIKPNWTPPASAIPAPALPPRPNPGAQLAAPKPVAATPEGIQQAMKMGSAVQAPPGTGPAAQPGQQPLATGPMPQGGQPPTGVSPQAGAQPPQQPQIPPPTPIGMNPRSRPTGMIGDLLEAKDDSEQGRTLGVRNNKAVSFQTRGVNAGWMRPKLAAFSKQAFLPGGPSTTVIRPTAEREAAMMSAIGDPRKTLVEGSDFGGASAGSTVGGLAGIYGGLRIAGMPSARSAEFYKNIWQPKALSRGRVIGGLASVLTGLLAGRAVGTRVGGGIGRAEAELAMPPLPVLRKIGSVKRAAFGLKDVQNLGAKAYQTIAPAASKAFNATTGGAGKLSPHVLPTAFGGLSGAATADSVGVNPYVGAFMGAAAMNPRTSRLIKSKSNLGYPIQSMRSAVTGGGIGFGMDNVADAAGIDTNGRFTQLGTLMGGGMGAKRFHNLRNGLPGSTTNAMSRGMNQMYTGMMDPITGGAKRVANWFRYGGGQAGQAKQLEALKLQQADKLKAYQEGLKTQYRATQDPVLRNTIRQQMKNAPSNFKTPEQMMAGPAGSPMRRLGQVMTTGTIGLTALGAGANMMANKFKNTANEVIADGFGTAMPVVDQYMQNKQQELVDGIRGGVQSGVRSELEQAPRTVMRGLFGRGGNPVDQQQQLVQQLTGSQDPRAQQALATLLGNGGWGVAGQQGSQYDPRDELQHQIARSGSTGLTGQGWQ